MHPCFCMCECVVKVNILSTLVFLCVLFVLCLSFVCMFAPSYVFVYVFAHFFACVCICTLVFCLVHAYVSVSVFSCANGQQGWCQWRIGLDFLSLVSLFFHGIDLFPAKSCVPWWLWWWWLWRFRIWRHFAVNSLNMKTPMRRPIVSW